MADLYLAGCYFFHQRMIASKPVTFFFKPKTDNIIQMYVKVAG